jgi:hypothetical protein
MNIRIAALGLLLALPAFAQKYSRPVDAGPADRAAMLKTLERGKSVKGSSGQYRHLPQLAAVALQGDSETPEQAVARIGESGAEIVETKGKLVLFRSARTRTASVEGEGKVKTLPAVVSARSGALGVLTGVVIVKPRDMADADAIASSHGLEKAKAYPQLQTVFYRAKAGTDIADVSAALQADTRVEIAYPEIIEHVRKPL